MVASFQDSPALRRGRLYSILHAALEYLIAILVSGSFLATLTKELGFSDSLTGILSSIVSLGCLFQILSLFYRRARYKKPVILFTVINELLFMSLFLIPLLSLNGQFKTALFVVAIISAYLLMNFAAPKMGAWMISLVDDRQRGRFTANKEIFSLITGMIFSFSMGALVDHFAAANQLRIAFTICAIVIFVLMVGHNLCLALTVEPEPQQGEAKDLRANIRSVLSNKPLLKAAVVQVFYYVATYSVTPFFGTYLIGELNLSLKWVSGMAMMGSIVRILVSRYWGAYADKNSFARMTERCLIIFAISYLCTALATPGNGKVMFVLYYVFHSISLGGLNSAITNLIYDYTPQPQRADSLAICRAASGLIGFVTTLAASPVIAYVQQRGNTFLGLSIYGQQLLSLFGFAVVIIAIFYVRFVLIPVSTKKTNA